MTGQSLTADDVRAIVREELSRAREPSEEPAQPARCPSHPKGGSRCVRREGHFGEHVDAHGEEWLIALRCRIDLGADGFPTCDRIEGHEGACVARPRGAAAEPSPSPAKRTRGVCRCGRARREHDGATHTGGCAAGDCKRYAP
jgi:hypothetical protein